MPMTDFARMARSDHSMRPPAPAATLQFKSPNACNICHEHEDEDAEWADQYVRQWHAEDYQKPTLERAHLVDAARRGNWDRLDEMLAYIGSAQRDEIVAASLIRSLRACESEAKWPVVLKALEEDPSPLVRAAAAQTLDGYLTPESFRSLVAATGDEYRLVRVRAAAALAPTPLERLQDEYQAQVQRATTELMASLRALPDDYTSHYNLGNIHMDRRDYAKALSSYQTAIKLRPDFMPPYVNVAFVYNATGDNDKAEASFRKALELDPNSPIAHLNLGMLMGELERPKEAERAFRAALRADPNSAAAAYNLGVLLAEDRPQESLEYCRKAFYLQPNEGRYGYTYAFFLHQRGQTSRAVAVLTGMLDRQVPYGDAYALLGAIYRERREPEKAAGVYRAARANEKLDPRARQAFEAMLRQLEQRQ
jgi:tetratricopeptide (TPR) repeat protein